MKITSLADEMDRFVDMMTKQAGEDEILATLMLLNSKRSPDRRDPTEAVDPAAPDVILAGLALESSEDMARTARMLVFLAEPEVAMLAMEGWTHRPDLPKDDPDFLRLMRGEISPSQLPPKKRGETLIVYAEHMDGTSLHRMWRIEPKRHGRRVLSEETDLTRITSRFAPLFMVDAAMRAAGTAVKDFPQLASMSDAEKRRGARAAVARLLALYPDAATTSAEHEIATQDAIALRDAEFNRKN